MRIVIVGGGVMGSSTAYWLTRRGGPDVTVVERDPSYRKASSALSASSIRQQFSTPVNIAIGLFGIAFLRAADRHLAVGGELPGLGLVEPGYLFLASPEGVPALRANHEIQRRHGADVALLERDELVTRFPWVSTEGIALASLGLSGEGWFDGYGLMRAFRRKAVAQGARYLTAEAVGAALEGGRVRAVRLGDGGTLPCDAMVCAAGPWAARVAAFCGVDLPVRARRRCVFVVDCPERLTRCPLVIDPSGAWLRPEGRYYICGVSPSAAADRDDLPLEVDHAELDEIVWPAVARRVPALERLRVVSAWAGYYEYNTVDQNGIVGAHPEVPNLYLANGFSGHGMQQSPAVGRGLAELILDGRYTSLDLTPLGFERLRDGRPLEERNVI